MWLPWAIGGAGVLLAGAAWLAFSPRLRRLRMEDAFGSAIRRGDVARVRRLLARGVRLDWPEWQDGTPPLHQAVTARQPAVIRELLAAGAGIDETGGMGCPALLFACQSGDSEMVRLLLDLGADPNYHWNGMLSDRCPLGEAVLAGRGDTVQALLDAGADIEKPVTESGLTALDFALGLRNAKCDALVVGPDGMLPEEDVPLPTYMAEGWDRVIAVLRATGARE